MILRGRDIYRGGEGGREGREREGEGEEGEAKREMEMGKKRRVGGVIY
jgi:hypothetical protein